MSGGWKRIVGDLNSPVLRLCIAGLFLLALWMALVLRRDGALLAEGVRAPDWRLPLIDRTSGILSLEDLKGQVVVLDFWAVSCAPCLRQIGILEEALRHLEPSAVTVVGVAIQEESIEEIRDFVAKRNPGYRIVVDSGQAALNYSVSNLPTLYVIDRQGNVAAAHSGLWNYESLAAAIERAVDL